MLLTGLDARWGIQRLSSCGYFLRWQLAQLCPQRLAVRRRLRPVALRRFGDVADGVALGRLRRVLVALGLNFRRGVEVGLLSAPRSGDVELLLVHRGIGHDVGAINRGALGAVGGDGVGVLEGGHVVSERGLREVVGSDLDRVCLVDAVEDDPSLLRVDLGDLPALAVEDVVRSVVDAGDDLIAGSEAGFADFDLLLAQPSFGSHQLPGQLHSIAPPLRFASPPSARPRPVRRSATSPRPSPVYAPRCRARR